MLQIHLQHNLEVHILSRLSSRLQSCRKVEGPLNQRVVSNSSQSVRTKSPGRKANGIGESSEHNPLLLGLMKIIQWETRCAQIALHK